MAGAESGEVSISGDGRTISAWWRWVGDDLVVTVSGGTQPHVGSVVLAAPRPSGSDPSARSATSSILNLPGHKDEPVARRIAERLAIELGHAVVVTAGIHEDGLDTAGIESYLELARRLEDALVRAAGRR